MRSTSSRASCSTMPLSRPHSIQSLRLLRGYLGQRQYELGRGPDQSRRFPCIELDLRAILSGAGRLLERFGDEAYFVALCARSGLVGPEWPHRIAQMLLAFDRFGMLGGAMSTAAIRHGSRVGLIDERGELTYRELDAALERGGERLARARARAGGGRRDPGPQPPGVHRCDVRSRQVRRADRAAEHRLRRRPSSARSPGARERTCSCTTRSTRRCSRAWSRHAGDTWRGRMARRRPRGSLEELIAVPETPAPLPSPAFPPKLSF